MLEDFLAYLRDLGLVDRGCTDPEGAVGEYDVYRDETKPEHRVYIGTPYSAYSKTLPRALTCNLETQKWSWWNSHTNERFDDKDPKQLLLRELQLQQTEHQERVQYALEQMSLSDDLLHKVLDAG